MPKYESWWLKLRRRVATPLTKIAYRKRYHVTRYRGADFLLAPRGITAFETTAGIFEYPELSHLMRRCAELKVDTFIDVGANIGIYSCVLLRNGSVPHAMLFEPDPTNRINLRANLLINGLLARAEVHEFALGDTNGTARMRPGTRVRSEYALADGGFSQIVADGTSDDETFEVEVARFDDKFDLRERTLAVKVDVEYYEGKTLRGMERTLRQNRCIVQVEAYQEREETRALMEAFGYRCTEDFMPNFVFENRDSL